MAGASPASLTRREERAVTALIEIGAVVAAIGVLFAAARISVVLFA